MRCGACDIELRPTARYCDACGAALGARAPEQLSPRDYTPRHLAERILRQRSALHGEHKQLTVLFVDVKGSLGLSESLELEVWHGIMDRFFAIVADVVHRFEGTINQFTGDGAMILFGAPLAHEDHALRACSAALRLRDELRRYAQELERSLNLDFSVRMGINSGAVVVGRIGDDLRMDYTAQGHTVGLAARMEQLADAGEIHLTGQTASLVTGFFRLRDLGEFDVKGASRPMRVFALDGIGELRTRFDASRSRGLTRFVGRSAEMEQLEAALKDVLGGLGRVVCVTGDAGVGKSRLCFEFAERCRTHGVRVRSGQAVAHGRMVPFLPLLEVLRGFFGISVRDGAAEGRRKIASAVALIDPTLRPNLAVLNDFLGVADPDAFPPRLDPEARQRELVDSVMSLVRSSSRKEPVVFLFEDLHWLDPASEAFLARLVQTSAQARVLVLLNFRPEYRAAWMDGPGHTRIELRPLRPPDVAQLLDQLLGSDPEAEELRRAIAERTAGNPFFVEELVQSLIEAGQLERSASGWRPVGPIERLAVPASLQAVLAARMDRLGEIEKQVLQTASVIGKRFPKTLLRRVLGIPDEVLAGALRVLVRGGFVVERTRFPDVEFAFQHPLTLEVAYATQLAQPRAQVHACVARALEELHPERLDEIAALLAHHAEAAGHALDAARWHRRAAEWVGVRDVETAHRHWRNVTSLVSNAPDSPEKHGLLLQAHVWMLQLAWRLGFSRKETARIFSSGTPLAERCGDGQAKVMLALGYGVYQGVTGDWQGQYETCSEAAAAASAIGNLPLGLAARAVMATSLHYQGRLREALGVVEWAIARSADDPALEAAQFWISPHVYMLGLRGLLLSLSGRFAAGERSLERALALAREIDDAEALACVHGFSVRHARCVGAAARALEHGERMEEVAEGTGIPLLRIDAQLALADALGQNARWDEAVERLERALALADARPILGGPRRRILSGLAEAYLGRGQPERARYVAAQLLALREPSRTLLIELAAQLVVAQALLREEGAKVGDAVLRAIAEAIALLEQSGARAFEPEIHWTLAELARHDGDRATQLRHQREAQRIQARMAAAGTA